VAKAIASNTVMNELFGCLGLKGCSVEVIDLFPNKNR
jgi:hypothetical protein